MSSTNVINLEEHKKVLINEKIKSLKVRLKEIIDLDVEDIETLLQQEKKIKILEKYFKNNEESFEFQETISCEGRLKPLLTQPNIETLLEINKMTIYFHEIKKEIFIETLDGEVLYQKKIDSFLEDEINRYDFKSKKYEILLRKLEAIALESKVNPVKDFILESYKKNKDNIALSNLELDRLFKTIKGCDKDKPVNYILFKTWMISTVACIFNDNFRSQGALTFTGAQGIGKGTWFNNLIPPTLRPYFKEEFALNTIDKDNYIESVKYWIVELSEIGRTMKDSDRAKSHITKQYDEYRAPYERSASKHKRNTVYGATVDHDEFLTDDVNRRWWTIKIIDRFDLIDINHELLFAELYSFYLQNPKKCHELNWTDIKLLNEHNKQFNITNETDSIILNLFDWESEDRFYMPVNDIGAMINNIKVSNHKVGKSLKKLEVPYKIIDTRTKQKLYEMPIPREIKIIERNLFKSMNYEKVIFENDYLDTEREGIKNENGLF